MTSPPNKLRIAETRLKQRSAGRLLPKSDSRQGSVLIAVLAIILLLSVIVARFVEEAIQDLEYRAIFQGPSDVRSFAYSMLEATLATIHEVGQIDDGQLFAPEQGWGDPLSYTGIQIPNRWDVAISIRDESGKLPINTLSESLLNRMFEESFDLDFSTARELSSVLLDWIDPDDNRRLNGAESDDYLRRNPPYRAANRPLQSLGELRLLNVWETIFFDGSGRPNERFQQLDTMVSVLHAGPANLNSAPEPVLELLALEDGFGSDFVFDGLRDLPYLRELPGSANTGNSSVETRLLRITVTLARGATPFTLCALVETNFDVAQGSGGGPGRSTQDAPRTGVKSEQSALRYPFRILELSERHQPGPHSTPARYSALDITPENASF